MTDRYLVEFQEIGKDYFKADCAFREGQEDLACQYVRLIVGGLMHVVAGRVLDTETRTHVYTLRTQDKLAVNVELRLYELVDSLATAAHYPLPTEQVTAIRQRAITHCAAQIAALMQS